MARIDAGARQQRCDVLSQQIDRVHVAQRFAALPDRRAHGIDD